MEQIKKLLQKRTLTVSEALSIIDAAAKLHEHTGLRRLHQAIEEPEPLSEALGSLAQRLSLLGVDRKGLRKIGRAINAAGFEEDAKSYIHDLWERTRFKVLLPVVSADGESVLELRDDIAWALKQPPSYRPRGLRRPHRKPIRPRMPITTPKPGKNRCECVICRDLRPKKLGVVNIVLPGIEREDISINGESGLDKKSAVRA
jgi:hypothetical protein